MLSQLDFKIFGLETIKEQYLHDAEFKDGLQNCRDGRAWNKFILNDGFVFRANKLCILDGSVRIFFVTGGTWRRINGTLWCQEDGGCSWCTLLLATHAATC
jgi:hypothetical protein